jgi:hypothetical protein
MAAWMTVDLLAADTLTFRVVLRLGADLSGDLPVEHPHGDAR